MARQRISYVPLENMDADMRREMERCQREGTPRPESSAIRAHVPAALRLPVRVTRARGTAMMGRTRQMAGMENRSCHSR